MHTTSPPTSSRSLKDEDNYISTFFSRVYEKMVFRDKTRYCDNTSSYLYESKVIFNKKQVRPVEVYHSVGCQPSTSKSTKIIESRTSEPSKRETLIRKIKRLGKHPDEIMTLSLSSDSIKKEFTFDYIRPLNIRNVPAPDEFQRLATYDVPKPTVSYPISCCLQEPGPSRYTLAHIVDTIELRRPDFVHASAGRQLVLVAERNDEEKWHVFQMGTLAYLTTINTKGLGSFYDFAFTYVLDDKNLLFWKRGEGRIALMHTPCRYFAQSSVTIYEIDLAIYWVAHDSKFVYFGGQEVKQVRPKGATMPLPPPRDTPFAIYRTKIDAHYNDRRIRRVWVDRSTEPLVCSSARGNGRSGRNSPPNSRKASGRARKGSLTESSSRLARDAFPPAASTNNHVSSSEGCTATLNKWHSVLVWFDGSTIRIVRPLLGMEACNSQNGKLQQQTFDTRTNQLSAVETSEYRGPKTFWSSHQKFEPFREVGQEELRAEFRPYKSLIVRVRRTLDNVWLMDLQAMVVRRLIIHSPSLPRCPLYAMCHSITDDGRLFVYCSTEKGGPLARRRGLRRPIDSPHADHTIIAPLSGVLRLEEIASYRLLLSLPRFQRYQMLTGNITNTQQLLDYFGGKLYAG